MDSEVVHHVKIAENPWFWLSLFGGAGILAIVVIGPKYAVRQARIERMAESRQRAELARAAGVPPSQVERDRPSSDPDRPEPYLEADYRRSPQLYWLLTLMTLLMLIGTAGLLVSRRRMNAAA